MCDCPLKNSLLAYRDASDTAKQYCDKLDRNARTTLYTFCKILHPCVPTEVQHQKKGIRPVHHQLKQKSPNGLAQIPQTSSLLCPLTKHNPHTIKALVSYMVSAEVCSICSNSNLATLSHLDIIYKESRETRTEVWTPNFVKKEGMIFGPNYERHMLISE